MKFVLVRGYALVATAMLMTVPNVASADVGDPLKGMTYADASALVAKNNGTAKLVVSTTVGSVLKQDECIVSRSRQTVVLNGTGTKSGVTFLVDLNCNDALATAGAPGGSLVNPGNKKEKEKQTTLAYINAHPEWCDESAENHDNCVKFCSDVVPGKCTVELD